MSFARNILRDLVEKRLWPVALLMMVAIVAIFVIGGGGSKAGGGEQSLPIAPAEAANASSAVELLGPPSVRKRAGKVVDPFRRAKKKDATAAGTSGTDETGGAVGNAGSGAGASAGGTAGGDTSGTSGGTPATSSTTDASPDKSGSTVDKSGPSAYDLTKVADVRFGKTGGTLKRITNLAPLTELPSGNDAIVMFGGALKDQSVARFFVVSNGGETTGTGECTKKNDLCVSIDMAAGDEQHFKVDGTEYELHLIGINSVKHSKSGATTGRAYGTRARFGSSAGASAHSIARLAPLGGGSDPALLYLGVYSDGKRSLFLLGPNASAHTQGDCMDGAACRVIGLRRGETGSVSVSSRRYVIKVESAGRLKLSATAAASARARVAGGGRTALRDVLTDGQTANAMSAFRYSTDSGTISRSGD